MSPVPSTSSSKLNTSGVHTPQFLSSTTTTTLSGLQEGYSSEQWGPWRSHGLLLQQSIRQLKWQDNAAAILKLMAQYSSSVKSQQQSSLSRDEFIRLLHDHSVLDDDAGRRRIEAQHLWDVFDRDQDGQLTETDLLAGLIAVDPFTPHDIESPSGMLRMQFIFLYFDEDRNGQLDLKEITALLMHLRQLRAVTSPSTASSSSSSRAPDAAGAAALTDLRSSCIIEAKALLSEAASTPAAATTALTYNAFYQAVKRGAINGTSQILRVPRSLAQQALRRRHSATAAAGESSKTNTTPPSSDGKKSSNSSNSSVTRPRQGYKKSKTPDLPLPRVRSRGNNMLHSRPSIIEPSFYADDDVPNGYTQQQQQQEEVVARRVRSATAVSGSPTVSSNPMIRLSANLAQRQKRTEVFALEHRLLTRLMEFTSPPQTRIDWNKLNLFPGGANDMLTIIDHAIAVLSMEDSLVSIPLPCRVYGDIHGQLPDLVQFFNKFSWPHTRKGDIFSMNYVFLGDFVDRGAFSVEVAALLFCLKVIYPTKVALVRGNHEDRSMNANYGFLAGAKQRFGPVQGESVWERANEAFEYLPLAAVVETRDAPYNSQSGRCLPPVYDNNNNHYISPSNNNRVLCIHGGIGDNIISLEDLSGIPKPITIPACSVAPAASTDELYPGTTCRRERVILDALWSDPTENDNVLGVHLSPRGQSTCRFGPDRVAEFCERNDLKLIIRAHECVKSGHEYFASGMLLTVFSATNYCNVYQNDGAMIVLVVDPETGEIDEHAQVIKCGESGQDTSVGWNASQFRNPSPLRNGGRDITIPEYSTQQQQQPPSYSLSNVINGGYTLPLAATSSSYPATQKTNQYYQTVSYQPAPQQQFTATVQQQQQTSYPSSGHYHSPFLRPVSSASRLSSGGLPQHAA